MLPETSLPPVLQPIVGPWYESLKDPLKAQQQVLFKLVEDYSKTLYGQEHNVKEALDVEAYRKCFRTVNYRGLTPYLAIVQEGNYQALLPEPVECWVMTRGSTGKAKVLPVTATHLKQIFTCGARALVHFALRKQCFEVFSGSILNLNFPSTVHTLTVDGKELTYGYSSGTYARLNPMFNRVSLCPRQEEIDKVGSGITRRDWERRFDLVYKEAIDKEVTAAMGVTPVILAFARYVRKKYGRKPCELWTPKALFCTSVRRIQFKYAPVLRKYYGQIPVVEMYTATEGVFAQQLDDLPYVTPNYDAYFFEAETVRGVKMLHELKRGEWGKLIISSCILPRYDMGDLIEAAGKNYFRVFGRNSWQTRIEHRLYRLFFGWLL